MSDKFLRKVKKVKCIEGYCCRMCSGPLNGFKRTHPNKKIRQLLKKHTRKEIKENT